MPIAINTGVTMMMTTFLPIYGINCGMDSKFLITPFSVGIARKIVNSPKKLDNGKVLVKYPTIKVK